MLEKLEGSDKMVLESAMRRRESDTREAFRLLFDWCNQTIRGI